MSRELHIDLNEQRMPVEIAWNLNMGYLLHRPSTPVVSHP